MPRDTPRNNGVVERSASRGIDSRDGAQYIRELQLLVGKQTVEIELLRAELDALKKARRSAGTPKR